MADNPFAKFATETPARSESSETNPFAQFNQIRTPAVEETTTSPKITESENQYVKFLDQPEKAPPLFYYGLPPAEKSELAKQKMIGVLSGVPGMWGDIETAGRAGLRYLGADVEPESALPTSKRVSEFFGAEEPTSKVGERSRSAGEFLGGLIGPSILGKALGAAGETLVGGTTKTVADLAKRAEQLGFKLEPRQLRAAEPKGSPGFGASTASENQKIANELVSAETGVTTKEINPKFIGERLKTLSKDYDAIFGQPLKVDRQLATDLEAMSAFERSVRPADVRSITSAADNVVGRFAQAQAQTPSPISAIKVDGDILQRLRSEMSLIARTATDGTTRKTAGDFVNKIDQNIARNHKDLIGKLEKTNREYAAAKTLEELVEKGGVQGGNVSLEKLGDHLAQNVYGFGSGAARHPLSELGTLGRELKIRGRFEGVETPSGAITGLLSKTGQWLNLPSRMQAGRAIQRQLPVEPTGVTGAVTAPVGGIGREFEER